MKKRKKGESADTNETRKVRLNETRKVRLSLDLTIEMKAVLDELATKSGTTQAEVLRRAIALLKAVKTGEAQGEAVAMVKGNRVVARLIGF